MAKQNLLKETWKAKGGPWKQVAPWMNRVSRLLNNMRGHGAAEVEVQASGIDITVGGRGGSGLDLSLFRNGITSVRTRVVTMRPGAIRDHGRWFTWSGADVSVPGAVNYITIRYERGVKGEYMTPAPSALLENDGTYTYIPLFVFTNGALSDILHLGAFFIE